MKQGLTAGYFPSMRESSRLQMPSDKDPLTWLTLFLQWKGILLLGFLFGMLAGNGRQKSFNVFGKALR
jgi:hypothetical protein